MFRIQDEIANAVVKALKVSLLGGAAPRSLGTQNTDAYLVFLQGRAKMATERVGGLHRKRQSTLRALSSSIRTTRLLTSNSPPRNCSSRNSRSRAIASEAFESASNEAKLLIERALTLDPDNAQAYIERGYLRAFSFSDPAGAEKDLRRGIELNPNSARGYAGLATVLYDDPRRRDEALAMVERAQQLDPLEPELRRPKGEISFYGSRQSP